MGKPDFDTYFMQLAYLAATRASCDRKHVGAVIVSSDQRVVATGYNGAPCGMPDCDVAGHEISDGHCIRTIHAEANAISYAGRLAMGCTLYCVCVPCYDCAKLVAQVGIHRVVFDEFYNSRYGKSSHVMDFLKDAGIECAPFESPRLALFKKALIHIDTVEQGVLRNTLVEYVCGCSATADVATKTCMQHNCLPRTS